AQFPAMWQSEAERWREILPRIAEILIAAGFDFVGHGKADGFAESLGWPAQRIHRFATPEEYLALYSGCSAYFGNRIHGGIVSASNNAARWVVGYDSRLDMVRLAGGRACKPSEFNEAELMEFVTGHQPMRAACCPAIINEAFQKQLSLLSSVLPP